MTWIDRNPDYEGRSCLVCRRPTREQVAPMGIASGRFPCHVKHDEREIMLAYYAWCEKMTADGQTEIEWMNP